MALARLVVVPRGTPSRSRLPSPLRRRVVSLHPPRIDISSTLVRRRATEGKPIRYLVPDKVANFIGAQSLYGASEPASTTV